MSWSCGTIPSRMMPNAAIRATTATSTSPITAMPGGELAVDDIVAIDRLGEQARQGALGSLAVDRVEGKGQTEQRRHQADEDVDPQDADIGRADGEQEQEDSLARRPPGAPPP